MNIFYKSIGIMFFVGIFIFILKRLSFSKREILESLLALLAGVSCHYLMKVFLRLFYE